MFRSWARFSAAHSAGKAQTGRCKARNSCTRARGSSLDLLSVKKVRFDLSPLLLVACTTALPAAPAEPPDAAVQGVWARRVEALALQAAQTATSSMPGVRVQVQAGQLDARLRLAPCAQVDVYLPPGHRAWGQTRVGLRCLSGPTRWNVFMPLNVQVFAPGLQASSALAAGTVLTQEHLRMAETEWSAVDSPAFARPEALLGRTLVRAVASGAALREIDLRKRQWFAVGDVVSIVSVGNGFTVSGQGVALSAGIEGQPARVRTDSGRTLTGNPTAERRLELVL